MNGTVFETRRLSVTLYHAASERAALAADPDVERFSCWPDAEDGAFAASIAAMRQRSLRDGLGWFNFAVHLHAGGYVGDHAVRVDGNVARLGIAVLPTMRRLGLAQEVIVGSIAWLRRNGVARVEAEIDPDNAASLATFERAGFRRTRLDRDEVGPYWLLAFGGTAGAH